MEECDYYGHIRAQTSLIGEDGLAAPLGNTGLYAIQGVRELHDDEEDRT